MLRPIDQLATVLRLLTFFIILTTFVVSCQAGDAQTQSLQAETSALKTLNGHNSTITSGTVEVLLQLEGKTVWGKPKVVPADKVFDALSGNAAQHYELRSVGKGRWSVKLPEGEQCVIGWLAGKRMFGFLSEPFEARQGRVVSFSPGMPATFEYDLSNPPESIPCFPARVTLMKKIGDTYLSWGGHRDLKKPGFAKIGKIASGEWMIDAQKNGLKTPNELRLPFFWDKRAVTIRPGEVNRFQAIGPVIDRTVEAGDVTIRGKLVDGDGKGVAGQEIRLILLEVPARDPSYSKGCQYFYPAQTTGSDGSFEFKGVDPNYLYQVEHWVDGNNVSMYSLLSDTLKANQIISIMIQVGKNTSDPNASCGTNACRNPTPPGNQ